MQNMLIDLKLFSDNEPEIPAELEGVDKDIALSILKEAGLNNEPETVESEEQTTEEVQESEESTEGTAASNGEADTDTKQVDDETVEPENQESAEEGQEPAHIPYKRFKEVNDKAKAKDAELAKLQAELNALRAQQNIAVPQQPPANQVQQPPYQQVTNNNLNQSPEVDQTLFRQVATTAYERAKKNLGLSDEDINSIDYADPVKKREWEAAYNIELVRLTQEANNLVERQQREYVQKQQDQQQVNYEYNRLVNDLRGQNDFNDVYQYACTEAFSSLQPIEQRAVSEAFSRTESGQGSLQDILIVKNHFINAQQKFREKQSNDKAAAEVPIVQPVIQPVDKIEKTKEKIKQMEAHPKVSQISGANSQGGTSIADLERMIQETNWEDLPKDIRDLALGLK
ncbi:hypothetical protein [Anaerosinus massiliensis]|uniref:hypothetical protein n=1 Tax=Massilibacillus massiliensis TaxID=1806837 RepID=UPI000DA61A2B|nr:hypothetical protein [Massilibacillus massiliensis]